MSHPSTDKTGFENIKDANSEKSFKDDCGLKRYGTYSEAEILHYDCSHVEYGSEPIKLSENFSIPPELQRRVNFWKAIYTQLSSVKF